MSVTDAFRLLNSSIRGIRQDRDQLADRKLQYENQRMMIQDQINDPQRKLQRQKAQAQLDMTGVPGVPYSPDGKSLFQNQIWQDEMLPTLRAIIPDDAEMTNKGQLVFKGTQEPYQTPKWKADKLQAELGFAFAMANDPEKALNREIAHIDFTLNSNQELSKAAGAEFKDKKQIEMLGLANKREKLIEDRDNPEKLAKRLASTSMRDMKTMNRLFQVPEPNLKYINALQNKMDSTHKMLASLSKTGKTNLKEVVYSKRKGDTVHTIKDWVAPGTPYAQTKRGPYGTYKVGAIKSAPGGSGSGKGSSGLIEQQRQDKTNRTYTDLKNKIASIESDIYKDNYLHSLMAEGRDASEIEGIKNMLDNADVDTVKNWKRELKKLRVKYRNDEWFLDYVGPKDDKNKSKKDPWGIR